MTSVKGAGYTSHGGRPGAAPGRFDPLNDSQRRGPAAPLQKKGEASIEEQCREKEHMVGISIFF